MPDILIRGMGKPKSCNACMFDVYGLCLINKYLEAEDELTHDCPLVELPPHGDLIDRDAFVKGQCNSCDGSCECVKCNCLNCEQSCRCDMIADAMDAPVIVPSEKGETQ